MTSRRAVRTAVVAVRVRPTVGGAFSGDRFPNAVFFGGQLTFGEETFLNRMLHNYIVFAVQRRLYSRGVPFVILPIRA